MTEITRILNLIEDGDPSASEQLLPLVYDELRTLAAQRLAYEKPGQTLQATALVHEAYIRLVDSGNSHNWNSCGHFFGAAAEAMRRILVENARRKTRAKHGGDLDRCDFQGIDVPIDLPPDEIIALDEALGEFAKKEPVKAKLVQLRFFAGLRNDEAAKILGISSATAKRYWRFARVWLHARISDAGNLLEIPE